MALKPDFGTDTLLVRRDDFPRIVLFPHSLLVSDICPWQNAWLICIKYYENHHGGYREGACV